MNWERELLLLLRGAALRATALFALGALALALGRPRSAAARHAVWTLVLAGMLISLPAGPLLPALSLPLLPAKIGFVSQDFETVSPVDPAAAMPEVVRPVETVRLPETATPVLPAPAGPAAPRITWTRVAVAAYVLGLLASLLHLAWGYGLTHRLIVASRPLDELGSNLRESDWLAVPVTAGWLRPVIVLPPEWRDWDAATLDAVLAHERAHISRADWAVAILARINASIFWFHPLAWWLQRRLAFLAEHACDDAALLNNPGRREYAGVLVEMVTAVRSRRGRIVWEAMAIAKPKEMSVRIDRILDETRCIPAAWSLRQRAAVAVCGVSAVVLFSMVHLAPISAQIASPRSSREIELAPIHTVDAIYPEQARAKGIEGSVKVTIVVGKDGSVMDVVGADGHPALVPIAAEVVRRWTYPPQEAPVRTRAEVKFHPPIESKFGPSPYTVTVRGSDSPDVAPPPHSLIEVTVGKDGSVSNPRAVFGAPPDEEFLANMPELHLPPRMEDGKPVEYATRMLYEPRPQRKTPSDTTVAAASSNHAIRPAVLLYRKEPEYPDAAIESIPKGAIVMLKATVGTDGSVNHVSAVYGHPLLEKAAINAVMHWRYRPATIDGVAVESEVQVEFMFPGRGTSGTGSQPGRDGIVATFPVPHGTQAPAGGGVRPAVLVYRKEPEYPKIAKQAHATGPVTMDITIGMDGSVTRVRTTSGHPMLIKAAMDAVRQWKYQPASLNGQPVESQSQVTLQFISPDSASPVAKSPAAPLSPSAEARQGGHIQPPVLIQRREPEYPKIAEQANATGAVLLNFTIGLDGSVSKVRVLSGHPMLTRAAEDAVRQWKYQPALLNGKPVESESQVTLQFAHSSASPVAQSTAGPQSPSAEARQDGRFEPPVLIQRREPEYPKIAIQTGAHGQVRVQATIESDGRIAVARAISGPPMFVQAAEEAVRQWRYRPAMLNGTPVATETEIVLNFTTAPLKAATPVAARTGGQMEPAALIYRKEPEYPAAAKAAGVAGTVVLTATIEPDGSVSHVRAVSGPPQLIAASEEAVRQWRYRPTMLNGRPVATSTQVPLSFTLEAPTTPAP